MMMSMIRRAATERHQARFVASAIHGSTHPLDHGCPTCLARPGERCVKGAGGVAKKYHQRRINRAREVR